MLSKQYLATKKETMVASQLNEYNQELMKTNVYEITNSILFSSDLGAQPGINIPVTEKRCNQANIEFSGRDRVYS